MGVRGLTSFIARDSDRYLKCINLTDCYLVIDGSCVASHLYKWCSKRDSAFGGDYDEYFTVVKNFFVRLKKCRIKPIVIFDGGYEQKKIKTVLTRLKHKLLTLKTTFCKGYSDSKFFPLFMRQIFCEVVASLKLPLLQCEFEADGEVAALARQLNCPVLSYDSDFFIYDVLYIPFSTVQLELALCDDKISYGLPCAVYDIQDFLAEYPGLAKCHLPLLATLLGNDFVESHIFQKFFQQIPLSKGKNMTNLERKILGLLHWLRRESEKSAIEKIKLHIGKAHYEKFSAGIEMSKLNYMVTCECRVELRNDKIIVEPPPYSMKLSNNIIALFASCKLPSFLINFVVLRTYFLPLQVENLECCSSHETALPIIQTLDQLLCSETGETSDLILYTRQKRMIKQQVLTNKPLPEEENLERLGQASNETRKGFVLKTLNLNDLDQNCVSSFMEECQLFMACLIFWSKFSNPSVFQVHALLLGYLASQAKNKVGVFRLGKESTQSVEDVNSFTALFAHLKKTTETARTNYSIIPVHAFSCFQSILYHCSVLNTLLGCPLTPCKVADSFCGTSVYNLHACFANRADVFKTIQQFLSPVASFARLYEDYYDRLCRYFPPTPKSIDVEKKRKRRRKPNTKSINVQLEATDSVVSNEEIDYNDLSNKFHLLST